MIKLKQITMMTMIGAAFFCSTASMGFVHCDKNEYWATANCEKCPANATCDGERVTGCKKGYSMGGKVLHKAYYNGQQRTWRDCTPNCDKNEYWNVANCEKCPANATCDGVTVTGCKTGYTLKGKTCEASVAQKSAIQKSVAKKKCKQASHESQAWIKKRYKNCTNCTTSKDAKGKKVYSCMCDC